MAGEKVVFVGNCQSLALSNLYLRQIASFTGQTVVRVDSNFSTPGDNSREQIGRADIVVVQEPDFPAKIQLSDLKVGARRYSFPALHAGFYWPFGNRPHVMHVESPHWDSPYGAQHGDGYLNRMIARKVPHDEAIAQYLDLDVNKAANLDRLFELYIGRQKARDEKTGIRVAGVIESQFRNHYLFFTPDHPNLSIFKVVAKQLYSMMGVDESIIETALNTLYTSPFPPWRMPLHPSVIRHFGLTFLRDDQRYLQMEGSFTFIEYCRRYLRYEWSKDLRSGVHLMANRGDPVRCLDLLERGLKESPISSFGLHHKANLLSNLGRFDEAREVILHAIDLEPANPELHANLGNVLVKLGDLPGAEKAALTTVNIFPNFVAGHRILAEVAARTGRVGMALASARYVAALAPNDAHARADVSRLLLQQGDLMAAEGAIRNAIEINPTIPGFHNSLAEVLDRQGRSDEALTVVREVVAAVTTDPHLYARLGHLLAKTGDLVGAEAAMRTAIEINPTIPGFQNSLAGVLDRQGRSDEALTVVREVVAAVTTDPHLYARLGHLLAKTGDLVGAEAAMRTAIEINPTIPGFHNSLAGVLDRQGRSDEALTVVREVVAAVTTDPHLYARLGHLLAKTGDLVGAEAAMRTAIEINPTIPGFQNSLAAILDRQGRSHDALTASR